MNLAGGAGGGGFFRTNAIDGLVIPDVRAKLSLPDLRIPDQSYLQHALAGLNRDDTVGGFGGEAWRHDDTHVLFNCDTALAVSFHAHGGGQLFVCFFEELPGETIRLPGNSRMINMAAGPRKTSSRMNAIIFSFLS